MFSISLWGAIMTIWDNKTEGIRTKFRKHDFDFSKPSRIIIVSSDHFLSVYECKKCGLAYSLDDWQIKQLPFDMARGCKGYKIYGQ
jgi:hypothetical protein